MILTKSKYAVNTFSSPGELFRPGLFLFNYFITFENTFPINTITK